MQVDAGGCINVHPLPKEMRITSLLHRLRLRDDTVLEAERAFAPSTLGAAMLASTRASTIS